MRVIVMWSCDLFSRPRKEERRRDGIAASLDRENISSRPSFGIDASVLLSQYEMQEEDSVTAQLTPYLKRLSGGSISSAVTINTYHPNQGPNKLRLAMPPSEQSVYAKSLLFSSNLSEAPETERSSRVRSLVKSKL
jgi:hypothetical protein